MDESKPSLQNLKLKECEVCSKNEAKYTCPRCELRTCCLDCIKIHKKELDCSGLRDRVKFIRLRKFDNIDLLNDYRLLEETARVVSRPIKLPAKSCYNEKSGTLPTELYRLKCTALSRGVELFFLPPSFTRHHSNTSHLNHKTQSLYWRIDWIFPQAGNMLLTDEYVLDSMLLSACVHKYIDPEEKSHSALSFYQAAGPAAIQLLLKADRVAPNRYYKLDPTISLQENLDGKSIIEYPVIYVTLSDHIYMFNVLNEEEEANIRKNKKINRRHQQRKRNVKRPNNNFLFSNIDTEHLPHEEMSGTEECTEVEEIGEFDRPNKRHHAFPPRGRGRGRGWGQGRGNFRNRWHHRRGTSFQSQRSEDFHPRAASDVNGRPSQNLSSMDFHAQ